MNDSVETAIEAVSENQIVIPRTAAAVVVSLAAYGGVDLTRKAVGKVKTTLANRKAKKAAEETTVPRESVA